MPADGISSRKIHRVFRRLPLILLANQLSLFIIRGRGCTVHTALRSLSPFFVTPFSLRLEDADIDRELVRVEMGCGPNVIIGQVLFLPI